MEQYGRLVQSIGMYFFAVLGMSSRRNVNGRLTDSGMSHDHQDSFGTADSIVQFVKNQGNSRTAHRSYLPAKYFL